MSLQASAAIALMKTEFLRPRFDGARFDEHTLPLEVARDLAAYETLVIEVAKHLYKQEHPDRVRVLRGFGDDFHLHLERVDVGSAQPMLSVVTVGGLQLEAGVGDYFSRARDLISECIAATEGQLPAAFPRHLLTYFNRIGRSLRPDESMHLPRAAGEAAVLTPERRKNLVLAADKFYEREIDLSGTIGEADWEKSTFRLRLFDGSQIVVPMPQSFHGIAREYGGRQRHQVTVKGIGAYDSWERLDKVLSADAFEIQPNYQLAARFEALSNLNDGWLDGGAVAPDKEKLLLVADRVVRLFPDHLPPPVVVPTPDGNLLFEWDGKGEPSLDVRLRDMNAEFHAFTSGAAEVEASFLLSEENAWQQFFAFLDEHLRRRPT